MNRTFFRANRRSLVSALAGVALLAGCAGSPTESPQDCSDPARFRLALAGAPVPPACSVEAPDEAYGLGEMIRERRMTIERATERLEAAPPPGERETLALRQQRIRAQGELPELEALARLEGWLPRATLPDR
ncbi:MAG TPA: hypothetical protein VJ902_08235 [Wenzhouxiangellaceae bacterium]|nr:hypothetical protein [Wenzhouxiangellaceae bacterium]